MYIHNGKVNIVKTRLIQIGNSRGVRLPKLLIEQAQLGEDIELEVKDGAIIISSAAGHRQGWAGAAEDLAAREEGLLDPSASTRFDEEEWEW